MNELALFAGAGGGLLASQLLGWNTVCAVEIGEYPREVLLRRQEEGFLDKFPIWDDVCTFDGTPWNGKIDVISGGFPCQDISAAGKGAGIAGDRSGLWNEYARIIGEVGPSFVFAENSPLLRTRGLGVVVKDLTGLGYDVRWGVLGAWHLGATHKRDRMWVLALNTNMRDATREEQSFRAWKNLFTEEWQTKENEQERYGWLSKLEPVDGFSRCNTYDGIVRALHGVADRVDRQKAIANGQVPRVAATAWNVLMQ